jgi:hypothetical protein
MVDAVAQQFLARRRTPAFRRALFMSTGLVPLVE